jgi:hypothetical protein
MARRKLAELTKQLEFRSVYLNAIHAFLVLSVATAYGAGLAGQAW